MFVCAIPPSQKKKHRKVKEKCMKIFHISIDKVSQINILTIQNTKYSHNIMNSMVLFLFLVLFYKKKK